MPEKSSRLTFADLVAMRDERFEETIRLEFKREMPDAGKNDRMARLIASMANSDGGTIIYGIEEDDDGRAIALYPFNVGKSAERVVLVAQNVLDEPLILTSVYSIPYEADPTKGFLVVDVPKSDRGPHVTDGKAWGRTAKNTAALSRRQIGELFARSPGFANEFGLTVSRPGMILVRAMSEAYQESSFMEPGQFRTKHNYSLFFENDGEADVFDASYELVVSDQDAIPIEVHGTDPFPLEVFPAGAEARIGVHIFVGKIANTSVRTKWRDLAGNLHEQVWPTLW